MANLEKKLSIHRTHSGCFCNESRPTYAQSCQKRALCHNCFVYLGRYFNCLTLKLQAYESSMRP